MKNYKLRYKQRNNDPPFFNRDFEFNCSGRFWENRGFESSYNYIAILEYTKINYKKINDNDNNIIFIIFNYYLNNDKKMNNVNL